MASFGDDSSGDVVVLAREVAPSPAQGPRSEAEVRQLFQQFKIKLKSLHGPRWRSRMYVFSEVVFGSLDGLLLYCVFL